jgi:hypothetical protein
MTVIIDKLIYGGQILVMDHELQHKQASEFMVWQLDQVSIPKPYVDSFTIGVSKRSV